MCDFCRFCFASALTLKKFEEKSSTAQLQKQIMYNCDVRTRSHVN